MKNLTLIVLFSFICFSCVDKKKGSLEPGSETRFFVVTEKNTIRLKPGVKATIEGKVLHLAMGTQDGDGDYDHAQWVCDCQGGCRQQEEAPCSIIPIGGLYYKCIGACETWGDPPEACLGCDVFLTDPTEGGISPQ